MKKVTYIEAITQALDEEMARDERVFLIGEDIAVYGGVFKATKGLLDKYGAERVIDSPISEVYIAGGSVGAALVGLRPVPEIQFADFITPSMDMIIQQMAKMRYRTGGQWTCPVTMRVCCGADIAGGLYHSQTNEQWFVSQPGLIVLMPSTPYDAKGLLKSAIRGDDPVIYFEHKRLYRWIKEEIPEDDFTVPIGKAAIRKEGTDLTLVTYGLMYHRSLEAVNSLEEEGISVELIDMRTLLPWDRETIFESVKKTSKVVLVQETSKTCGVMAEVGAAIAEEMFDYLDAPVTRVCGLDVPAVPFAPPMEHFFLPNAEKITRAVKKVLEY
ncbi:MAG: alpha-ketoacid dehydrogenase subunit beta [candidate division Zixibacteria bacterium]|jgi:2-oxoisovalerate dehydrogenase E1 component beta subunit|nr:alpha-ketoacid dehydrogenase subunit beta [candidate division Zixibacteria bacterium]